MDLYNLDNEECTTARLPHGYEPGNYFVSNETPEEICTVDEFQRRGTTFPLNIENRQEPSQFFALMDTGAMRSCINYNTFHKLNVQLTQREVLKVIGADGGDLGSMGTVQLTLGIGSSKVTQNFIMCRELRRNIILGVDFAKHNCAGIQWTTNRTRVLSLNGIKAVEVEEDELGIPVTASYHIKIPPRHNAVFEVNIHAETEGTQVIKGNKHLLEKHPNMYQHEIAMMSEEKSSRFPLLAITNLDHVKTLHLAKGEVVGFAIPESSEVTYIATTNELNVEEVIDVKPRNWIPQRKWSSHTQRIPEPQAMNSEFREHSCKLRAFPDGRKPGEMTTVSKDITSTLQESTRESPEHSQNLRRQGAAKETSGQLNTDYEAKNCEVEEHSQNSRKHEWCELNEVVDSDFLISPGDIYPNRKVELEDADIKEATRISFEALCEQQHEAFSKNNKDIGHTQLRNGNRYRRQLARRTISIHLTVKTLRLGTSGN